MKTVPPLQPAASAPAAAAALESSPLGPRLRRNATRSGDAVPYGTHGEWGLYREGVKEMTTKIAGGALSAGDAAKLLSAEGVRSLHASWQRKRRAHPASPR